MNLRNAALAAVLALSFGVAAQASPITYNFSGVTQGGGAASGSFVFDTSTDVLGAFSFGIGGHGFSGPLGGSGIYNTDDAGHPYFDFTFYDQTVYNLYLDFGAGFPGAVSPNFTLLGSNLQSGLFAFGSITVGPTSVPLISGAVTVGAAPVPEPGSLLLLLTGGLALAALAWCDRRRAVSER